MDNAPRSRHICQHGLMKIPRPLPADLTSKPFTRQEALDAGVSVGRLRYRDLDSPSRQIYVPGSVDELQLTDRARPLTLVTPFSAASHATAFLLWGFPGFLPRSHEPGIHISRPDTVGIPRRRGVIGHRGQFFEDEITTLDGMYITSRARTWLDCARRMDIDEITVVADHLLRVPSRNLKDAIPRIAPWMSSKRCLTGTGGHRVSERPAPPWNKLAWVPTPHPKRDLGWR